MNDSRHTASASADETHAVPHAAYAAPAKITLLYESRDGRLCLFEDAKGHLFVVPSSLLA